MNTLKEKLTQHLRDGHGFVASGDLQRLPWKDSRGNLVTPSNISRRLRELAAEGILQVQIRRGHAYYRIAEKQLSLLES
jgi:DNA-binding HxlR family transcriptional regulator